MKTLYFSITLPFAMIVLVSFISMSCHTTKEDLVSENNVSDTSFLEPQFGISNCDLAPFISNILSPILRDCIDTNSYPRVGSFFLLHISADGNVYEVKTIRFEYLPACEDVVKNEFLNMGKWIPARKNGIPVSSTKTVSVIIKW